MAASLMLKIAPFVLASGGGEASMPEMRKLAAILAADVVGFSRLAGVDEDRTLARLRALRSDLIDPTIAVHHGRVVKRTGDGALVEFRSVVDAVRCAVEIQHAMVERNAGVPEDRRIEFRIGVHLGDVVEESDGDLMGDGVNIAARLEGIAQPGAICLSEDAYRQVRARLDLAVSDLGDKELKNIAEPVRVYTLEVGRPAGAKGAPQAVAAAEKTAAPEKPSIAVLPFQNMSGDAEQDYFADGISEDIITALSKLSQLFVIARNSSFTFKGKTVHVREIGRTLGVRYVLEGSARKAGARVRITAQLIDATNDGHLWAERFDRDLTDIFAVQDDVTGQIVKALALNLTPADRRRMAAEHTDNMEAFDCFLRGRELWWRHAKEPNGQARELLLRATGLDPGFAPAYGWLSAAHINDYVSQWTSSPSRSLELGFAAAERGAALDPQLPIANWTLTLANLWMRRHDAALRVADAWLASNPNDAEGLNALGMILHYVGRSGEALSCFERAMALNPLAPGMWLHFQGQAYYQLGRYEEGAAVLRRRIFRNPETDASRVLLAATYGQMGRLDEAREQWREALRVNPDYSLEHRRKVLPYKNPADFEAVLEGLRKAGVAE
jgi:TolB-like protein/class 3 adenylate cyclase